MTSNNLLQELNSDRVDERFAAIEKMAHQKIHMDEVTQFLRDEANSDMRIFIAERMLSYGQSIVPHLERLFASEDNYELRKIIAVLLLDLGSKFALDWLIRNLHLDQTDTCWIARKLKNIYPDKIAELLLTRLVLHHKDNQGYRRASLVRACVTLKHQLILAC